MAFGTRTMFRLEVRFSAIHKIRENALESSRNVSGTIPCLFHLIIDLIALSSSRHHLAIQVQGHVKRSVFHELCKRCEFCYAFYVVGSTHTLHFYFSSTTYHFRTVKSDANRCTNHCNFRTSYNTKRSEFAQYLSSWFESKCCHFFRYSIPL